MKSFRPLRLGRLFRSGAGVIFLFVAACSSSSTAPPDVVARINGVDITAADLEEEYLRNIQGADPLPSAEEADDLKLQLLNEMITDRIMMQRADEHALTATDAEVDVRFNEFKSQYSAERFQEILEEQQMTTEDLREELRRSLTIEKLINKEITSKISVSDADIEAFYNSNKERFNLPQTFQIAHILVTPVADSDINNLEGDDATSQEQARDKATRLLGDVQGGQDFATVARRFSEDPSTAPDGGNLGFQPMESIAGVDPALADAVSRMRVGETFPTAVQTRFGFHVLKLLNQDAGGQKDLSDPRVEAQIRQLIFQRRDQLLRGAFYEQARNSAEIENYFAERILARSF